MKLIKNLTLAALAATLLFQIPVARADYRVRDQDNKATFTKFVATFPNQPGLIATFGGVVGGTVGNGTFTGEVLLYNPGPTVSHFVAFYRFNGSKHSFTALVDVIQTGSGPGTNAKIIGVVTDGWRKGQAVKGNYTEGTCGTPAMPCYTGALEIEGDSND